MTKRSRITWTTREVDLLVQRFATATEAELLQLFPGRSLRAIRVYANNRGLKRAPRSPVTASQRRRMAMAQAYLAERATRFGACRGAIEAAAIDCAARVACTLLARCGDTEVAP
jgi:hypothetical protein